MSQDRILQRYHALARRAAEALEAAAPVAATALPGTPEEAIELIEDAVFRLGPYVSAMPGARPHSRAEIERLAIDLREATEDPR